MSFKAPGGLTLKVAWLGSDIKTCRSHKVVCVLVQVPGWGLLELAPLLAGTEKHQALDTPGSPGYCNHGYHHL